MATVQPALAWGNRQSQLHIVARAEGLLEIVLGLHCIEVVPRDPASVQYRMAMGRLVNAGWEVTALGERFGHDTRTLRGWGEALLCPDPAEMLRRLSGRGADSKVTSEIVEFVLDWWDELCVRARSFRTRILAKVAQVFKVQVSWEALRPALLARRRARAAEERATVAGDICPATGCADWGSGEAEPGGDSQPVAGPAAAEPLEVLAVEAAAGALRGDCGSLRPANPCGSGSGHEAEMDAEPQPMAASAAIIKHTLLIMISSN